MKIDRILEIIILLTNHDSMSAKALASKFEVSIRTIQRDINTLSAIGIPVYANSGKYGGYAILPHYKVRNANISRDEQQMILTALESLSTTYTSDSLSSLVEKYNAIIERDGGPHVFWDFGVTKENQEVQNLNASLESAISQRHYIRFDYRDGNGKRSSVQVEPLAIHYKWYAWYLFAHDDSLNTYRTFKVARMHKLTDLAQTARTIHKELKVLMAESEQAYYQTCYPIRIRYAKSSHDLIQEFFPDCPYHSISEIENEMTINVPLKERLWRALLLSFGGEVKVISPKAYVDALCQTAKQFLSNYDI